MASQLEIEKAAASGYLACLCEHEAHFHDRDEEEAALTPHGNPGHTYGQRFHVSYLDDVKTDYGSFRVCKDCAKDCHCEEA